MTTTLEPLDLALEDADGPAQVLDYARSCRATAQRAEADLLAAAVVWAEQHSPESIEDAACWPVAGTFGDHCLELAGPGAPSVAEFAVAEFAAALGMSTDSGRRLIGQAIELAFRLPKHWARVQRGDLPSWRARRLAEQTMSLSLEAAGWVDGQLAAFLHKTSYAAQERLVAEAIARFDPERAQAEAEAAQDGRHVRITHPEGKFGGTCFIEGELDLADGLDLEAALKDGARTLRELGSTDSLDVRRSHALGGLGRGDLPLDLDTTRAAEPDARRAGPARTVVIYAHLSEAALRSGATDCPEAGLQLARVENARQVVTADLVRRWCGSESATVIVKPVIDLDEHIHVGAYEVPDRLAEQSELRDHMCVFPWCQRPAKSCDKEHPVAYSRGGPTCSCNDAPVCRRHHRLKTHSAWSYVPLEPGTYVWTSPHGYSYLVDGTGTIDVTSPERRGRPLPPHPQAPE